MPRPRRNPGALFGYDELSAASGLDRREIHQLVSDMPEMLPPGRGIRALKRLSAIGAFRSSGMSLLVSARLLKELVTPFNDNDGEVPTGLKYEVQRLPASTLRGIPEEGGDYYYHQALLQHPNLYFRGKSRREDVKIEIINGKTIIHYSDLLSDIQLIGWIVAIERGKPARINGLWERLPVPTGLNIPEIAKLQAELIREALAEQENATSRTIVNVSLAIRSALDRVSDHRARQAALRGDIATK